jgi:nucleotide-binding universal stress UspA family protein
MAVTSVLVPIDFSAQHEAIVAQGARLAKAMSAKVVLLHSLVAPEISVVAVEPIYVPANVMERFTRDHTAAATRELNRIADSMREMVPVEVVLKFGDPVEAILTVAEEKTCDVIVMGSHGAGLDRFLLGSVAEAVARGAPCPVVVARQTKKPCDFRNVIVGIDFSVYSAPLVGLARGLAHPEARIHLVHSWQPPHLDSAHLFGDPGHERLVDTLSAGLNHHVAALENFASQLPEDERYELHVETGRPAAVLLETYDALGADVIMVGAHDTDRVEHVLGTVSDRVLRHADTTLLLTQRALPKYHH